MQLRFGVFGELQKAHRVAAAHLGGLAAGFEQLETVFGRRVKLILRPRQGKCSYEKAATKLPRQLCSNRKIPAPETTQ